LTTAAAVDVLVKRHPALLAIVRSCRVAINHEFVSPDALVPVGAEFVLIPPVAGG
jgi:molybdopterin converting factor small subunit